MLRSGRYKLIECVGDDPVLYDLQTDPEELKNIAGDADYAECLRQMRQKLSDFVDIDKADAMAFEDQALRVEELGGEAVVRAITPVAFTKPA